ncbi:MAG: MFS transporter [Parvibaculum sp.]|jgi:MFS family permease|uniref:MFS transporter n=1 Tax=Parvibaculum sp. TaxID=2024848 RepID=UPI00284E9F9C|nr:MFS transporter [Parvibaculum sp.]MDR3497798.1 MFS transporter [Parvibaculum sp.]
MRDINDETTSPRADLGWYMGGIWLYFISAGIQGVIFPWIITIVLHESSARVGIAQMMMMLPMLIFTLFGGALADRMELRRHLMRLQLIQTIPPLALAALIHFGFLTYHLMLGFGVVLGILGAYVMPTRDAMLTRVAISSIRGNIQRAVALAMSGQFLGQVAGFLVGGTAMIAGAPSLFVLQSVLLACAAYTTSRLSPAPASERAGVRPSQFADIKEGLVFLWRSDRLRPVVTLMLFSGVLFMGVFMVLFPILIRDVYHGSSPEIALINMCFFGGIGLSSFTLSRFRPIRRQGRAIMLAMCTGSSVMVLIHFNPPVYVVDFLALCWGLAGGVSMTQSRAIMQETATHEMRARLISAFQLGSMGGGPIGALMTGYLIAWLGPLDAVLVPVALMVVLWLSMFFFTPLWQLEAPRPGQ